MSLPSRPRASKRPLVTSQMVPMKSKGAGVLDYNGGTQVSYNVDPYCMSFSVAEQVPEVYSGVHFGVQALLNSRSRLLAWFDSGFHLSPSASTTPQPFQQVGVEGSSPVLISSTGGLSSRLRFKLMRSWGSGRLPFLHYSDVSNAQLMRGSIETLPLPSGQAPEQQGPMTKRRPHYNILKVSSPSVSVAAVMMDDV